MKLSFAGRSVLFTGDTVGRKEGSAVDAIIAAEKAMVEGGVELNSDVVVAPPRGLSAC